MDIGQIRNWKEALEREVAELSDRLVALNSELVKKRQQLELLNKLVDSEIGEKRLVRANGEMVRGGQLTVNPSAAEVRDRVFEILTAADRPMNIKEIHAEFLRKGVPIPGKGTHFNILIHISREVRKGNGSRFYRASKGTYAVRKNVRVPSGRSDNGH